MLAFLATLACAPKPASSPDAAVKSYASAVRAGRYEDAYAQLSQETRAQISFERFKQLMEQNGPEVEALLKSLEKQTHPPLVKAVVRSKDGEELTLIYQNGAWRIDESAVDLYRQEKPRQSIASFIRAYDHKRYDILMRFVPDADALDLNEQILKTAWEGEQEVEIEQIVEGLRASLDTARLEVLGDRATMSYGSGGTVELLLENGSWKIQNFQ